MTTFERMLKFMQDKLAKPEEKKLNEEKASDSLDPEHVSSFNVPSKGESKKIAFISSDWKDTDGLVEEIETELKEKFGLYVYDDPNLEGSDLIGLIISDVEMSEEELKKESDEMHQIGENKKGEKK